MNQLMTNIPTLPSYVESAVRTFLRKNFNIHRPGSKSCQLVGLLFNKNPASNTDAPKSMCLNSITYLMISEINEIRPFLRNSTSTSGFNIADNPRLHGISCNQLVKSYNQTDPNETNLSNLVRS